MCATCGCNEQTKTTLLKLQTTVIGGHGSPQHIHADGTRHSHRDNHCAPHSHPPASHDHDVDPHVEHSGIPDRSYGPQRGARGRKPHSC